MYTEEKIVAVAKRENNNKRKYLVVNKLQGKHIPVKPSETMKMFNELAELIENKYNGERILIVGFAETATAIGAAAAVKLKTKYIQTTREDMGDVSYLYFTESHSHAAEQKLVREDIEKVLDNVDRIIFAEDEITTGNTILKIIDIIDKNYEGKVKFAVMSILNGMDKPSLEIYEKRNIEINYLVKTNHQGYTEKAESFSENGEYIGKNTDTPAGRINEIKLYGKLDARRCISGSDYLNVCEQLWNQIKNNSEIFKGKRILVTGTEEFMFPAIYIAEKLEKSGFEVKTHSTTRSPIAVSSSQDYPFHRRFELLSLYDDERVTYIYDIEKYDSVLIITDSANESFRGVNSLINALESCGNKNIYLLRWN